MSQWYTDFAISIAKRSLLAITPDLRQLLVNFAEDFRKRALKTPNPFDDMAAAILYALLGMHTEKK